MHLFLSLLYWGVILLFGYIPLFWWGTEVGGYEWVKTLWAFLCIWGLVIWQAPAIFYHQKKALAIGILAVIVSSILTYLHGNTSENWLGTMILPQGGAFWIAFLSLIVIMRSCEHAQIQKLQKFLILTSIPVGLYALAQTIGIDPVKNTLITTWEPWRAFSTFGNPNTLAVYALLLLPMSTVFEEKKYLWQAWIVIITLLSGSLSIALLGAIFIVIQVNKWRKYVLVGLSGIALILIGIVLKFSPVLVEEKLLSGWTRIAIWWDILHGLNGSSLVEIMIGHGAGNLGEFFATYRSEKLNALVPSELPIDRAHNIFLDILWSYGLVGLFGILAIWTLLYQSSTKVGKQIFCLFLLSGMLHTPLLIHYLLTLTSGNNSLSWRIR